MESIRGAAAVRCGIGQWLDELELLDDGARPAVGDDDGQGILVLRTHVNEVDVETIDLGDEVRHGVEAGFDLAPVVVRRPVTRELLHGRERHALRKVADGFLLGQPGRDDAPAQVGQVRLRDVHLERTNRG